jgi:tripartite-type tricarboxylate transporter receptor subunit TctC
MWSRRLLLAATALLTTSSLLAQPIEQQGDFPSKPIRIVVPYSPGAINDMLARALAKRLEASMGQSVVVENRAGGGAVIGTSAVANAAADGYTLLQVPAAHANNATLVAKLPYDSIKSFSFITLAFRTPVLVLVKDKLPVKSIADLVSLAREKPGNLTYGSTGNGGAAHLMGEMLKQKAGIDVLHVPYKGAAPAMTDLMGGRIDFTFASYTAALPALQAGRARAIAVTGTKRLALLPDLPTVAEAGIPGYEAVGWWGYAAPAGTPPAIIERLNREINAALVSPELRTPLEALGIEVLGTTPEQFSAYIRSEIETWRQIIRKGNIHKD